MYEARDPAIKLFGATIPVATAAAPPQAEETEVVEAAEVEAAALAEGQKETPKEAKDVEVSDVNLATEPDEANEAAPISSSNLANGNDEDKKSSTAEETAKSEGEETKTETECSAPDKLKKPDKILPCPRCNSMETKFCYYNNYKSNQPRHFCKNCQRYWTAGGTMRNVPVGAGRRKSKHSSSQCRDIVIPSEELQPPQLDTLNLTHHRVLPSGPSISPRPLMGNGTILKFGQEVPLCESMASVLSIKDQTPNADSGGRATARRGSKEEPSCASSATAGEDRGSAKNAVLAKQSGTQVCSNGVVAPMPPPLQWYPGAPWAYPWSATWNNAAAVEAGKRSSGNSSSVSWSPTAMMAGAAPASPFCTATLPFPFVPAPFWGFAAAWPNGAWNLPLVGSNGCISPSSPTSNSGCSGNSSPTLGKHSRDSSLPSEENAEKSLWVPKTLRIDDPEEAAKSSIWVTLGIKPDIGGSIFQSKAENKAHKSDAAQVLQANPAALSRSQSFQETT